MQADYDCAYSHRLHVYWVFLDASSRQITWPEITVFTSNQRNLFFGCFLLHHRRIFHRFHPMAFEQLGHFALKITSTQTLSSLLWTYHNNFVNSRLQRQWKRLKLVQNSFFFWVSEFILDVVVYISSFALIFKRLMVLLINSLWSKANAV